MSSILEAIMLICFGFSWPINVYKSYKARTAKSTSLSFILLIITGYIAGITAKLVSGQINFVLIVYLLNLAIVSLNIAVYFRNRQLDKAAAVYSEAQSDNAAVNSSGHLDKATSAYSDRRFDKTNPAYSGRHLDKANPAHSAAC